MCSYSKNFVYTNLILQQLNDVYTHKSVGKSCGCNDIVTRIIVTHITCDKSSLDLRSMLSYTFIPDVFACAP